MLKSKYYSLKEILKKKSLYNIIFGERSNGKTYAVLKHGIEQYVKTGSQLAIIRRYQDDFKGKRGAVMFEGLVTNGEISRLTNYEWSGVSYYAGRWFFNRKNDKDETEKSEEPFAYGFSLASMEHDKSTSYPKIRTVMFDEFLTRSFYLTDEFTIFMNVLSTIIRDRNDVTIFMLGNTVNKYCPYFNEMGLTHIKQMKQGDIDVYEYGDSGLRVAVEYCKPNKKGKSSDTYFAFNNPKLSMITSGTWEIDLYPHLPYKYRPKDVLYNFFIVFDKETLHCEVINCEDTIFIYIHRKTTPLEEKPYDMIYSQEYSPLPNHSRFINRPVNNTQKRIAKLFKEERIFYQDNEVGEIVRNYLSWCTKTGLV